MKSRCDIPKTDEEEIDVSLPTELLLLEEYLRAEVSKTKESSTGGSFGGERVLLEQLAVYSRHPLTIYYLQTTPQGH